jgi:hypothetical protein
MPSITQAIATVYRDLAAVARALGALMILAIGVVGLTQFGLSLVSSWIPLPPNAAVLLVFVTGLVQVLLLTPYFIAIHRFILLGERATTYALAPREPRFQLFFTVWAAFLTLALAPSFVLNASRETGRVLGAVWGLVVMIAGLRMIVLFPAIAVDSPGATPAQALAATKGHAWRIFGVVILAALPLMVGLVLVGRVMGVVGDSFGFVGTLLVRAVDAAIGTVEMTLFNIVAARFYQWLGQRVQRSE